MMVLYLGCPTIEGKEVLGASSPDMPALHMPEPLSMTTGIPLSTLMLNDYRVLRLISTQMVRSSDFIAYKLTNNVRLDLIAQI